MADQKPPIKITQTIRRSILAVHPVHVVTMPVGSKILSVAAQRDNIFVWYVAPTTWDRDEPRSFHLVFDGDPMPTTLGRFLATVVTEEGRVITHVFEEKREG